MSGAVVRFSAIVLFCISGVAASAEPLGKGHRILLEHGLQIQGMVGPDDPFHLETYQGLNYTAVNWIWASRVAQLGPAPGAMRWARWASAGDEPPRGEEGPYMPRLLALSLGDEPDLNNPDVRDTYVKWFNAVQKDPAYANTILYINNYGGQVNDAALGDFIKRARPDMISFDVYPYRFAGPKDPKRTQPTGGSPINWYSDLRRYRAHASAANIPLGLYRQTYHSIDEGVRDVSESEFRLLTFAALTFNAKYLIDFTYNTGASSLFEKQFGGDNRPTPFYAQAAQVNKEARNLGKALVRLKPVADAPGAKHTTSMMIIRGRHTTGEDSSELNDVPGYSGFAIDPASPRYTDWEFGRNDPYLSGPFDESGTTNLGSLNAGLPGDVFLSWFKPLDESSEDVYLMVFNGLADMDGTGEQTRQRVKLNFGSGTTKFPYDHLQKLDRATGEVVDAPLKQLSDNVYQLNLIVDGGTAELLKFPTGNAFIGAGSK